MHKQVINAPLICMHIHLPSQKGPAQIIKMMTSKAKPGIAQQMAHEIIMKRVVGKVDKCVHMSNDDAIYAS